MARYGHFDVARREYVITHPELPQPWHNYISNGEHCGLVTHTGGGASFWRDPLYLRLLRYKFHLTPYDRPGRWVYIRDQDTGRYWSATWNPVQTPLSRTRFECRVGMGYNRITTRYAGIEAEMLYFVPPDDDLEIWRLTLRNVGRRARRLRTFSYAEWAVWGVTRDLLNIDNASACARYAYDDGVFWHNSPIDRESSIGSHGWFFPWAYFTSDAEPVGYDGSRDHFLGPYRDESRPIVVERGEPTNLAANGLYPLGSLAHDWRLRPGESRTITYQLGAALTKRPLPARIRKYRRPGVVDAQFAKLRDRWEDRLASFQADTPDERFNTSVNTWLPYQVINVTGIATNVSPVQWGANNTWGFRDNGQYLMTTSAFDPALARRNIEVLSHAQNRDGTVVKNFCPPNFAGKSEFLDGQAWYPIFAAVYLKETGDLALLAESFPYVGGGRAKLLDKIELSMRVLWLRRGPHGLPATGHGDWNDSLNPLPMESESVFNAMLFCAGCGALAEIYTAAGRPRDATRWTRRRKQMAEAIERHAWDGAWYRRMFLAGTKRVLGSRSSRKWGKIFLEPQAWAALCGALDPKRAARAMDSARRMLATRFGLRILTPPCPRYEYEIGSVGIENMGIKENGSVYSHCNAWAVCAEALLGRGELAFRTFMDFLPISRNDEAEIREIEPYVLGAQVQAAPFVQPGRGRNPWVTGSATWAWMAASQYILGIRAEFDGLRVDPCIPSAWDGFTATRRFRGATYRIAVRNPRHACRGVARMTVNGRPIAGCIAPLPGRRGGTIEVEVTLGPAVARSAATRSGARRRGMRS